jgi:hypothetical protein
MADYEFDQDYQVSSLGHKELSVRIKITTKAWGKCDKDVQDGVQNILQNTPISILAGGGHGNGIKYENGFWVFHTQTSQRLATDKVGKGLSTGLEFKKVYNH